MVYLDQILHSFFYLNIVQPLVCKALMRLRRASIILVGRGLLVKMLITLEPHGIFRSNFAFFFGTRDLFNISFSRELYLFSKFLHFEEIVRAKMAVCFELIVSET